MLRALYILCLLFPFCIIGCSDDQPHTDEGGHEGHPHADDSSSYPLKTCVVSGEELGSMGDPVIIQHGEHQLRLCCQSCVATFEKDPAKYLALLAEASEATSSYPLKTCVVSGEELGSMGDPVVLQHEGQEVRLCCQSCIQKFQEDPARYLAKLKQE